VNIHTVCLGRMSLDQARLVARQLGFEFRAARQLGRLREATRKTDTELSAAYLSRIEGGETATSIAIDRDSRRGSMLRLERSLERHQRSYVPKLLTSPRKAAREEAARWPQWARLSLAVRGSPQSLRSSAFSLSSRLRRLTDVEASLA